MRHIFAHAEQLHACRLLRRLMAEAVGLQIKQPTAFLQGTPLGNGR